MRGVKGSRQDLTAAQFGRLKVVSTVASDASSRPRWLCRCDCGSELTVRASALLVGKTRSCGCLMKDTARKTMNSWLAKKAPRYNQLPPGMAVLRAVIRGYKGHALERGYEWGLSATEAEAILRRSCHYCGAPPKPLEWFRKKLKTTCDLNGIDRIDNDGGYVVSNVVPCCGTCNSMKGRSSQTDFVEQATRIADWWRHQSSATVILP